MAYIDRGDPRDTQTNLSTNGHHIQQLKDGTIEMTDTLSKRDYYRSLRKPGDNASEHGSGGMHGLASQISLDLHRGGTLKSLLGKKNEVEYKPSGHEESCHVLMLEGTEKVFSIDRNAYGIHLFEKVCRELDLREIEYFGMTYRGAPRTDYWLKLDKRLSKQLEKEPWRVEFHVRYYPVRIEELKDDLTRYFLCLQVRQDIISGQIPCSFHTYAVLGAYVVQSEAGDYDPETHNTIDYISNMPFAPHALQTPQLLHRIVELHRLHQGQTPIQADYNFLQNARRLALYGVEFHRAQTPSGEPITVGVYHSGILIYRGRVRIARILWPLMVELMHKGKIFSVTIRALNLSSRLRAAFLPKVTSPGGTVKFLKTRRRQSTVTNGNDTLNRYCTLNFILSDPRLAKKLWESCTCQHAFFRLRESPTRQRANLTSAFTMRKYHLSDKSQSNHNFSQADWLVGSPPAIQRVVARRKPQHLASDSSAPVAASEDLDQSFVLPTSPASLHFETVDARLPKPMTPGYRRPGPVRPPLAEDYWRMSPADCTPGLGMNNDGSDVAAMPNTDWQGCRSNRGIRWPGAYFYEAMVLEDGLVRLGWSTNNAKLVLGTDSHGFGYGMDETASSSSTGKFFYGNLAENYGVQIAPHDVIGCFIELTEEDQQLTVQWSHNGRNLGPATFIAPYNLRSDEALFPTASLKNARVAFNFGYKAFRYPPKFPSSSGMPWTPLVHAPTSSLVANQNVGWRVNPQQATSNEYLIVSPNGRMVQAIANSGWQGFRVNKGIFGGGKYYYEVKVMEDSGLARVGFAFEHADLFLGMDALGYGFGGGQRGFSANGIHGIKVHGGVEENYGATFGQNDIIGCFLDLDTGVIQWSKNGRLFGNAYWIPEQHLKELEPIFPAVSLIDTTLELNFGDLPFEFPPETDWLPIFAAPDDSVVENPIKLDITGLNSGLPDLSLTCPEPPVRTTSRMQHMANGNEFIGMNGTGIKHQVIRVDSPVEEDEVHTFTGRETEDLYIETNEVNGQRTNSHMRRPSFTRAMTSHSGKDLAMDDRNIENASTEDKMLDNAILQTTHLNPEHVVLVNSMRNSP